MDNAVHIDDETALAEEHELMGHVRCGDCGVWMEPEQVAMLVPGDAGYCAACSVPPEARAA